MDKISYPDLLSFSLFSEGKDVSETYDLVRLEVSKEVNKVAHARFEIIDGGVATQNAFSAGESEDFAPGKKIAIEAGYMRDGKKEEALIFEGIVMKHGIKINEKQSLLSIECRDEAIKLTLGRKNEIFLDKKDSALINEILSAQGLDKAVAETNTVHSELVQYYCSDWDFVLMRADANGMLTITDNGKVCIQPPDLSADAATKAVFGINVLAFKAHIDAHNQLKSAKSYAWSSDSQEMINASGVPLSGEIGGNLQSTTDSALAEVINLSEYILQSSAEFPQDFLENWASASLTRAKLSMLQGELTIFGTSKIKPTDLVEAEGFGKRFDGKLFVGGVRHTIEEGLWKTTLSLGMRFGTYAAETPAIAPPPSSGLLAPMSGLHTAIVNQIHDDPMGQFRVKITIPSLQKENVSIWARMANLYASNEAGTFFYPEVNDEVVVGFMNDDPRNPVILGKLYSKNIAPPLPPEEENKQKAIITKEKLSILFNDEDKSIEINTPGEHKIFLDDKNKELYIEDGNKNNILLSKDGIKINSSKDVEIVADKGKILFQGTEITTKATKEAKTESMKIDLKASMELKAEGATSATLQSTGQTVVKGGVVMIN